MNSARAWLVLTSYCAVAAAAQDANVSSGWDWGKDSPENQGLISSRLESLWSALEASKTTAFLVIRDDKIVFERYAAGHSATTKHYSASMAKALVGGVSAAIALSDGRLGLDDRASKYVPLWSEDPVRSAITIRHLGSHTSGLADAEEAGLSHEKLTGWKGDFWKRLPPPNDPFTVARGKTPLLFAPGTAHQYSNPGIAMLGYAITHALKGTTHADLRSLLRDRVMRPIGVPDNDWSAGYGQTFDVEGLPLVAPWGGGNFTPRAVARVGRLMLRQGDWEGKQLLSASAVASVTSDAGTPGNGGIGWWSNNEGIVPALPKGAFWGAGAGHQLLLVVPSLKLIVVRNGESLNPARSFDVALRENLFEPLIRAVDQRAARRMNPASYPPSPVIQSIEWAPQPAIVRKAKGSDNWPLTWADDDHLYTAYGDGNGFEPFTPEKLSLGFARVNGPAAEFTGENVRSVSLEQRGEGKDGKKASGILMVDGILYLWTRNAANAQLAWSTDHGKTWTWSDWKFTTSFGCPTFLNFGKNYAGARDGFVYVYSHDSDSAYEPADRFVLARAPKDQIRARQAYQFFRQLDAAGQPIWTSDIKERGAVFSQPGMCYRSAITYNAGLRRYLWCQTLPGGDARFRGGFAIYDAPNPWGPWSTVLDANPWDVGPGETSSFPTKWMSADGLTLHLVFSGEDSFSVRKASLTLLRTGSNTAAPPHSIKRAETEKR